MKPYSMNGMPSPHWSSFWRGFRRAESGHRHFVALLSVVTALAVLPGAARGDGNLTDTNIPAPLSYHADWRWVQGTVFVPTSAVNEAQQWDEYDPVINDRELHYASIYGINCVRVYLHF